MSSGNETTPLKSNPHNMTPNPAAAVAKMAATINISGIALPRLSFGLGSLMKWAPNHAYPLPTDSSVEVRQAIQAGFRHFNTGDLYTNNASAAQALRESGLQRDDIFLSLKLNTFAMLGCKGREHMIEQARREIERFNLGGNGYVDVLQLHFPPRAYAGNLSNREAWRVLEDLKDEGLACIIGVSNCTVEDLHDIFDAKDLKHPPRIHEYEFNPFLLHDPKFQELRKYEVEQGVVSMHYGILTAISGRLPSSDNSALVKVLDEQAIRTGISTGDLLLAWAYFCLGGFVVTTSTRAERLATSFGLLAASSEAPVGRNVFNAIEQAAADDGFGGKVFYEHPHMEKARLETVKAKGGASI